MKRFLRIQLFNSLCKVAEAKLENISTAPSDVACFSFNFISGKKEKRG